MNDNLKNGLLVLVAVATIANTIILLGSNKGIKYEKTPISQGINNAVATPNQQGQSIEASMTQDNQRAQGLEQRNVPTGPKTDIQFASLEYDFGTIEQNSHNPTVFTFTNTGENPLIITDAQGSCGCTVPNYPREPIPPGGTGEIEVVYNPGTQSNRQQKTVTITANTEPATTILNIKANVTPGTDGGAGSGELMIGG